MLGQEIVGLLCDKFKLFTSDKEVDIANLRELQNYIEGRSIDWIINCAAYTAVDDAEDNSEIAYRINESGILNLGEIASRLEVPLIHVSTDYVFNGRAERPYVEEDNVDPIGVYGKSKYAGENKLRAVHKKHFIIRTSWLYGRYGKNFVNTMISLMSSRDSVRVVNDQKGCPTWARDLANFIVHLVNSNCDQFGTYHFSNDGIVTWYEFAQTIYIFTTEKKLLNKKCSITPCTTEDFVTKAERPKYSVMSKEKVRKQFNYQIPNWKDSLKLYLEELLESDDAETS